jgi:uncharacterized RmlC-like cupin family protein
MRAKPTDRETLTCRIVKANDEIVGKQGLTYRPGISAQSVGAQAIHLQTVVLPPGAYANPHKHASHETAIHVLTGVSAMWYGPRLTEHMTVRAGDYLYIPADMPHQPYNPSLTEPCVAIIARTDPKEQESVVLLPELDVRTR